jgi:hypothetical protein
MGSGNGPNRVGRELSTVPCCAASIRRFCEKLLRIGAGLSWSVESRSFHVGRVNA